jgi:hypothetical protein
VLIVPSQVLHRDPGTLHPMKNSRIALSLVAVLALAGCGANSSAADKKPVESDDKSPLAEYMGEGFSGGSANGGFTVTRAAGPQESDEQQLANQRKIEDSTAACMKTAGFDYVAVPPEANPKSKFDDAFNLPKDKFAEQYGYGISTIDWSKLGKDDAGKNPNTAIRNKLSATAKKAYDKALNGDLGGDGSGGVVVGRADGQPGKKMDTGCRGKAAESVYGKGDKAFDLSKYDSLFKDIDALRKRIDSDQRVVDATAAWSDCLADAGHAGFKKVDEPRQKVSDKLDELQGKKPESKSPGAGKAFTNGPPSFDKVDQQKLADLRKFEIELAKADQGCKAKVYDASYKKAQFELEKEFVASHKTELEAYRDGTANR